MVSMSNTRKHIILLLLCLLFPASSHAFLENCREVKKEEKCKSGEERADYTDARAGHPPRPIYRCCKDTCRQIKAKP